ncbi:sporulation protein YtxC [Halobacillus sp. K22]|uniref:sporulation protein YtxC n=1 Tax=Halobacillus sp. K22 TaxID=3457431 RepID=UPI003FCD68FB
MFCVHFSKRAEAVSFLKAVDHKQKYWFLKKYKRHFVVLGEADSSIGWLYYKEAVEGLIVVIRERKWLGWIEGVLKHRYYYEDQEEIQRILEIAREFEDKPPRGLNLPAVNLNLRTAIQKYVSKDRNVDFDGLSAYCLEDLHSTVLEYTGLLIDEYKQEESFQLLLDSWRSRVHHKDTGIQLLHLLENGSLHYFHDEGNPLSESETLLYRRQYPDDSINDLPLRWTITPALVHAPDQLIIYSDKASDSELELLMSIFEEKASWKPISEFPFEIS